MSVHKVSLCAALIGVLLTSMVTSQRVHGANRERKAENAAAKFEQVELFDAMKAGTIAVRFIPADSRSANVMIKNNTDKPLSIKLPEAFAGVPVLAQAGMGMGAGAGVGGMGGGGMGGMGGGGMGGMGGGGQGMGGGFGGGMGGFGGGMGGFGGGGFGGMGGMGGGFFNVAPEKEGKIKVTTVCLEHGKDEPTPRMKYTIQPIESFSTDARVVELCKMVGRGEVAQHVGQAAMWHVANGLSWEELAAKDRTRSRLGLGATKYFTPEDLALANQTVGVVTARTRGTGSDKLPSPGELQERTARR